MIQRYFINQPEERIPLDNTRSFAPNYNAHPTQILPVLDVQNPKGLSYFYWGNHPDSIKGKSMSIKFFNAPLESLKSRTSQKNALLQRRCLVLMNGFYCWKKVARKREVPYCVRPKNDQLLFAAGIWEEFDHENGERIHAFNIITKNAPSELLELTPSVPLFINTPQFDQWNNKDLSLDQIYDVLAEHNTVDFRHHPVSTRINNLKNNSADLLQVSQAADQFGNYTLFD